MSKILVTGGTGFIGSHTVVELQNAGFEVIIIDNLSNSNEDVLNGIEKITGKRPAFYKGDVCNANDLATIFTEHKDIEAVIHFAAYKAVGESVEKPLMYYRNNVGGLVNLLEVMLVNNITKIVFSSSCTVYGEPENLPVTEMSPVVKAMSPYGNTKMICEDVLHDTSKTSSLKAISLRYFNPIGAHDSSNIGELPLGVPNNLVPFITQTAIGKREKLTVFGEDYNTRDGSCVRDYIHVVDLAIAHVKSVQRLLENKTFSDVETFNVGTGNGFTVLEVIRAFEEVTGEKLNYTIGERRPGDVEAVWADTSKANQILGFKTERDLNNMLKTAWDWEVALSKK